MKNKIIIFLVLASFSGFGQITRTLPNVNNTADSLKPVSKAQATINNSLQSSITTNTVNIATNTANVVTNAISTQINLEAKTDATAVNKIVLFGDSITAFNDDTMNNATPQNGFFNWGNYLLGNIFGKRINAGIGGNTTTQLLSRIYTDVIKYSPKYCFVMAGVNDINNSFSETTIESNLTAIYKILKANGIIPIISTITPYTSFSTAQQTTLTNVNIWIRNYATTNSILFTDLGVVYLTNPYGAISNTLNDAVHPSNYGALLLGQRLYSDLNGKIPSINEIVTQGNTKNILGLNPTGLGTSGTSQASNSLISDNFYLNVSANASSVITSKIVKTDGSEYQQIATDAPSATTVTFGQAVTSNFSAGDNVTLLADIENDATVINNVGTYLRLAFYNSSTLIIEYKNLNPYTGVAVSVSQGKGILAIRNITVPSNTTSITCEVISTAQKSTIRAKLQLTSVVGTVLNYLPLSGGSLSGTLNTTGNITANFTGGNFFKINKTDGGAGLAVNAATGTNSAFIFQENNIDKAYFGYNSGGFSFLLSKANLDLYSNNAFVARLDNNSNFLIGSTTQINSTSKLQVTGNQIVNGDLRVNGSIFSYPNGATKQVYLEQYQNDSGLLINALATYNPAFILQQAGSNKLSIAYNNGGFSFLQTAATNPFDIYIGGTNITRFTNTGVGIGTSTPTSKLQVVGLPMYADNATALAAGLTAGAFYRTSTGVLMVAF